MQNKLVYIGFGYRHHLGGHAGYHQIKEYLGYDYIIDAQSYLNSYAIKSRFHFIDQLKFLVFPYFCFGFNAFPWFLFKCLWMAITKGNLTFHFIYGENLFYDFSLLKVRGCKTVVTLHQPYDWFKDKPSWRRRLKAVDQIILVGESEVEHFKKLTGKNNVLFVPHGICTDFYNPDTSVRKERMILTVGNWLRDYNFADRVYQKILKEDNDIRIVIVTNPKNKTLITPDERLSLVSGISDEDLLDLYRKTSCLFLPLVRYTANNALLEAGAVGCPILISCNYPDNSYLPEHMVKILPMNEDDVVNHIMYMIDNYSRKSTLSEYVNNHFGWKNIANTTKRVLDSL